MSLSGAAATSMPRCLPSKPSAVTSRPVVTTRLPATSTFHVSSMGAEAGPCTTMQAATPTKAGTVTRAPTRVTRSRAARRGLAAEDATMTDSYLQATYGKGTTRGHTCCL